MVISAGRLVDLYRANPEGYREELDTLLGVTTDDEGYTVVRDPVFKPRQLSIKDVGEAFVGREGLRRLYEHGPYGIRGGRAQTVGEAVGGGALGPSQFQDINVWLGTVDGLIGAELLEKYELATMQARELVTWKMGVRVQENKLTRYGFTTAPSQDIQPGQEFPSQDLTHDWVRAQRMKKQAASISLTWEAMNFDQTDSIMDAIGGENGLAVRFGVVIDERITRAVFGIDTVYNRLGTPLATYLSTGTNHLNQLTTANELTATTAALDVAEQLLLAQTDPNTGLEIAPSDDTRFLITTPYKFLTATRLASPYSEEIGALADASRMQLAPPPPKQWPATIQPYRMIRAVRLMTAATTADPPGLGLTVAQARERWIWGSTRLAFQYRSAKDITSYQRSITDDASLARRDVLMELDVSEMGGVTCTEPRYVVRNVKDA